ncbi:futalosine hydrolase [Alkalicoccus halolimnae]|uniref:Futalosine hydrolase n=1 Tax=Alkalicoccus halolimnae TaxID=1667239 RepID=A0A5C7FEL0_9BACI|nr:futalosine hydrolase [Alkalicoccus halolimnae]TXF82321.1 futalosine hydrolase [Alkalicoccus halolimnae]
MASILIMTAVEKEREAVLKGLGDFPPAKTALCGFGPVESAVRASAMLASCKPDLLVNAGIAGAIPGRAAVGETVIGEESILADLGAESPEGFLSVKDLGFGTDRWFSPEAGKVISHYTRGNVHKGQILTLSTVTGTELTLEELKKRYPHALAEAMEGAGAAAAAAFHGVPFLEMRTISNLAGPRDRGGWELDKALEALTDSIRTLKEAF